MRLDPPGLTGPPPTPATRQEEEKTDGQDRSEVAGNKFATALRATRAIHLPDHEAPRRTAGRGRTRRRGWRRVREDSVPSVDVLAYTAFNDFDHRHHHHVADGDGAQERPRIEVDRCRKAEEEELAAEEEEDRKVDLFETTTCLSLPGGLLAPSARVLPRGSTFHQEHRVVRERSGSSEEQKTKKKKTRSSTRSAARRSKIDDDDDDDHDGGGGGGGGGGSEDLDRDHPGGCGSDNTARFPKPIIRRRRESRVRRVAEKENERRGCGGEGARRQWGGRNYGLFFVLYLLAWPLLCTTSPSGQIASAFAQKSPLAHGDGHVHRQAHDEQHHRNGTLPQQSLSVSTVAHQHHEYQRQEQPQQQQQQQQQQQRQQQHVQVRETAKEKIVVRNGHHHHRLQLEDLSGEKDQTDERHRYQSHQGVPEASTDAQSRTRSNRLTVAHPYNEYTWELNQINPWLSACDLAGPAPADLQGSCGPPEVPKNCPVPCTRADSGEARFLEVIERLAKALRTTMDRTNDRTNDPTTPNDDNAEKKPDDDGDDMDGHGRAASRTAPEQCLFYLEESHKRDVCRDDFGRASARSFLTPRENRYRFVSGLRLRHCCEHAVVNALAPGKAGPLEDVLNGGRKCVEALDKLLLVDKLAARLHCEFEEVLARYDCAQPYSVIHNCTHCKEAYRKWVCSSLVPYFAHGGPDMEPSEEDWTGTRLRPCRSFCQSVEQRCPYLLPGDRAPAYPTQYAGEPTFLCRDPNIPETGWQAARALHSGEDGECCFRVCSEERPGSGICANCTLEELKERGRHVHPPSAPQCEVTSIQSGSTGQQHPGVSSSVSASGASEDRNIEPRDDSDHYADIEQSGTPDDRSPSSTLSSPIQQGASFCGGGGVGSMTSTSSSSSCSRPSVVLHLFLAYTTLASLLRALRGLCPFREDSGIRRRWLVAAMPMVLTIFERICRGWRWWRSWRRSSSRHFRWKRKKKKGAGAAPGAQRVRDGRRTSLCAARFPGRGCARFLRHGLQQLSAGRFAVVGENVCAENLGRGCGGLGGESFGLLEEAYVDGVCFKQCQRARWRAKDLRRGSDRIATESLVVVGRRIVVEGVCLEEWEGVRRFAGECFVLVERQVDAGGVYLKGCQRMGRCVEFVGHGLDQFSTRPFAIVEKGTKPKYLLYVVRFSRMSRYADCVGRSQDQFPMKSFILVRTRTDAGLGKLRIVTMCIEYVGRRFNQFLTKSFKVVNEHVETNVDHRRKKWWTRLKVRYYPERNEQIFKRSKNNNVYGRSEEFLSRIFRDRGGGWWRSWRRFRRQDLKWNLEVDVIRLRKNSVPDTNRSNDHSVRRSESSKPRWRWQWWHWWISWPRHLTHPTRRPSVRSRSNNPALNDESYRHTTRIAQKRTKFQYFRTSTLSRHSRASASYSFLSNSSTLKITNRLEPSAREPDEPTVSQRASRRYASLKQPARFFSPRKSHANSSTSPPSLSTALSQVNRLIGVIKRAERFVRITSTSSRPSRTDLSRLNTCSPARSPCYVGTSVWFLLRSNYSEKTTCFDGSTLIRSDSADDPCYLRISARTSLNLNSARNSCYLGEEDAWKTSECRAASTGYFSSGAWIDSWSKNEDPWCRRRRTSVLFARNNGHDCLRAEEMICYPMARTLDYFQRSYLARNRSTRFDVTDDNYYAILFKDSGSNLSKSDSDTTYFSRRTCTELASIDVETSVRRDDFSRHRIDSDHTQRHHRIAPHTSNNHRSLNNGTQNAERTSAAHLTNTPSRPNSNYYPNQFKPANAALREHNEHAAPDNLPANQPDALHTPIRFMFSRRASCLCEAKKCAGTWWNGRRRRRSSKLTLSRLNRQDSRLGEDPRKDASGLSRLNAWMKDTRLCKGVIITRPQGSKVGRGLERSEESISSDVWRSNEREARWEEEEGSEDEGWRSSGKKNEDEDSEVSKRILLEFCLRGDGRIWCELGVMCAGGLRRNERGCKRRCGNDEDWLFMMVLLGSRRRRRYFGGQKLNRNGTCSRWVVSRYEETRPGRGTFYHRETRKDERRRLIRRTLIFPPSNHQALHNERRLQSGPTHNMRNEKNSSYHSKRSTSPGPPRLIARAEATLKKHHCQPNSIRFSKCSSTRSFARFQRYSHPQSYPVSETVEVSSFSLESLDETVTEKAPTIERRQKRARCRVDLRESESNQ